MQTITTRLGESRTRLVQQGSQFVQQSTGAAGAFLAKTRKARQTFGVETRNAGKAFTTTTTEAGKGLLGGLKAEATMWLETLEASVRLPALPALADGRGRPSPTALERDLLVRVEELLAEAKGRVHTRVAQLDALVGPQIPASVPSSTKSRRAAASPSSHGDVASPVSAPIGNYDELSAKEIVTRLERLSDDKAAAVHAYELATKKRATVLRAAELRLAAEA